MKRFSRFFTFLLAFILCMSIGIATTLADDGSYTVFVGGVELTIDAGNTVAYATNDAMGAVTTVGADADHHTIRFELVEGVPTVTLTDATVQNAGGNGIEAVAGDLTVVGVDTPANGENAVSGGKNGIFARGAITIKGAMGDITRWHRMAESIPLRETLPSPREPFLATCIASGIPFKPIMETSP